jgi:hypothetical protein
LSSFNQFQENKMFKFISAVTVVFGSLIGAAQSAQAGQCVVAGRVDDASRWAPRVAAVQLFNATGKQVLASDKAAFASVTQVKIMKAVPVSSCDGSQAVKKVDDLSGNASDVKSFYMQPTDGMIAVKSVSFPALRSGSLVELELR